MTFRCSDFHSGRTAADVVVDHRRVSGESVSTGVSISKTPVPGWRLEHNECGTDDSDPRTPAPISPTPPTVRTDRHRGGEPLD